MCLRLYIVPESQRQLWNPIGDHNKRFSTAILLRVKVQVISLFRTGQWSSFKDVRRVQNSCHNQEIINIRYPKVQSYNPSLSPEKAFPVETKAERLLVTTGNMMGTTQGPAEAHDLTGTTDTKRRQCLKIPSISM